MFKVQNDFKGANISRTIRFTEPLFDKLNKLAEENNISLNLLVLQCCKYVVDSMESKDGLNYKTAYLTLFNAVTDVISDLTKVQKICEDMCVSTIEFKKEE